MIGFLAVGGVAVPLSTHGAHAVVTSAVLAVVLILAMLASNRVMTAAGWLADLVVNGSLRLVRVSAPHPPARCSSRPYGTRCSGSSAPAGRR